MRIELTLLKSRVARRIFTLFILCSLLPIAALALLSYGEVTGNLKEQSRVRLHQTCSSIGMSIFERLLSLDADMQAVAAECCEKEEAPIAFPPGMLGGRLERRFNGMALLDSGGQSTRFFGEIDDAVKLSKDERRHVRSGKTLISWMASESEQTSVYLVRSTGRQEKDARFLVGKINAAVLWGLDADGESTLPPLTELSVFDESLNLLFSSIPVTADLKADLESRREKDRTGSFEWTQAGDTHIGYYRPVFLKGHFYSPSWLILVSEPKNYVMAPISSFRKTFPLVVLFALGLVILASISQIRRNLHPIEILSEGTRRISGANYDAKVHIRSGDEFETLGEAFNKMGEKIKESQALLVRNAKLSTIGQMSASIVHEINQPLMALSMLVEYGLLNAKDEEMRQSLHDMEKSVDHLSAITMKFRTFSGKSGGDRIPLNINDVLDDVLNLMKHLVLSKRVTCTFDKAVDLPPVFAVANPLQQVFLNLFTNAIDALEGRKDGVISLRSYLRNRRVCVDIADNGTGIPEEIQEQIFDPFFTTKSVDKGTGLGLAIIHSILKDYEGLIDLKSAPGSGTRFTVSFPSHGGDKNL